MTVWAVNLGSWQQCLNMTYIYSRAELAYLRGRCEMPMALVSAPQNIIQLIQEFYIESWHFLYYIWQYFAFSFESRLEWHKLVYYSKLYSTNYQLVVVPWHDFASESQYDKKNTQALHSDSIQHTALSVGWLQGVRRIQHHPEGPDSYLPSGRLGLLYFRGHRLCRAVRQSEWCVKFLRAD